MVSSDPAHTCNGTRTASSAPGAWKKPSGAVSSTSRESLASGSMATCLPGPSHICAPLIASSVLAPMEWPTPATTVPGCAKAFRARVKRLARRRSSSSVGKGEARRSKCGATTVKPAAASVFSKVL